ncbi:MAG: hypothetical protein ACI8XC_004354, partial [Gammaproteobacteria bacterium]
GTFQFTQRFQATTDLCLTPRVMKSKLFAGSCG